MHACKKKKGRLLFWRKKRRPPTRHKLPARVESGFPACQHPPCLRLEAIAQQKRQHRVGGSVARCNGGRDSPADLGAEPFKRPVVGRRRRVLVDYVLVVHVWSAIPHVCLHAKPRKAFAGAHGAWCELRTTTTTTSFGREHDGRAGLLNNGGTNQVSSAAAQHGSSPLPPVVDLGCSSSGTHTQHASPVTNMEPNRQQGVPCPVINLHARSSQEKTWSPVSTSHCVVACK
jgi:hypothetical protein